MTALFTLTDDEVEKIVMEEFSRLEAEGILVKHDCDVTLARRVAYRLRVVPMECAQ